MALSTLDPKPALVVIDLQKGITARLGETAATDDILAMLGKTR
jgi:nicotinamidase-related amidase